MIGNEEFIIKAKNAVREYAATTTDEEYFGIYVVWSCYILGHQKALLSTTIPDGRYYEVTYNSEKNEMYVDSYKKECNRCIKL